MAVPGRAFGAIVMVMLLGSSSTSDAAPVADAATDAVERPLSPGAVALLLPHVSHPGVVQRLAAALAHPTPDVRITAARVAFITRHRELIPALRAALDRETEDLYAAEIVRALTLIEGERADQDLVRAATRLGPVSTDAWIDVVMRMRPQVLLTHLPQLGRSLGDRRDRALGRLATTMPDAVDRVFGDLASSPALQQSLALWYAGTSRAISPVTPPPSSVTRLALQSRTPARLAALFSLAIRQANRSPLSTVESDALSAAIAAEERAEPSDGWEGVVLELARRNANPGTSGRSLAGRVTGLPMTAAPASFWSSPLMAHLDDGELAAIVLVAPEGFTPPQRRPVSGVVQPPDVTELPLVTRMPRPIVPSLLPDLVRVLRCKPKPAEVAFFALTYRPSGQAREVTLQGEAGSETCTDVAKILTALEVADGLDAVSDQRRDLVVIPMRATDLACLDRPVPKRRPTELGGRIAAPRKTKHVLPLYPPKLVQERVQGVVMVEAIISSTGCVAEATVTRAVHPLLDASAVVAVSQWEYAPTFVNGEAVPVIMTVTVKYSLQP